MAEIHNLDVPFSFFEMENLYVSLLLLCVRWGVAKRENTCCRSHEKKLKVLNFHAVLAVFVMERSAPSDYQTLVGSLQGKLNGFFFLARRALLPPIS